MPCQQANATLIHDLQAEKMPPCCPPKTDISLYPQFLGFDIGQVSPTETESILSTDWICN